MLLMMEEHFHVNEWETGLIGGSYCFAFTLTSPLTGRLIKAVGPRVKELLTLVIIIKATLFSMLTYASFRPDVANIYVLVSLVSLLGWSANIPYTICRTWVVAFCRKEEVYSKWATLNLMILGGLIWGYVIGLGTSFLDQPLEHAFGITAVLHALVVLRYFLIPAIDLDLNSMQNILDTSDHDSFQPPLVWYLGVFFRTGMSFTSRAVIYWTTLWYTTHYGMQLQESQIIFLFSAITAPLGGSLLAGYLGDLATA